MPIWDYLLPALSFGAGAATGKAKKQTATSSQAYDPALNPLKTSIINSTNDYLTSDPNLEGYKSGQISSLNKNSDLEKQKITENLALHGIDPNSPAGVNAINAADSRRFAGITTLNQQVPLEAQQMRGQIINNASNVLNSFPRTNTSSTVAPNPGGPFGAGFSDLASTLAYLYGRGAFGKKPLVQGQVKQGASDIGGIPGLPNLPSGGFGLPGVGIS